MYNYGMVWVARFIHWIFLSYTVMLFVRVVGSWFPSFQKYSIARFVASFTDPYLNLFRRFIPPIGGALDLSPLLGFFALEISERIMLWFLNILNAPIA